eukprot:scaffold112302_cov67-Phaeocystis_antarctica.AAC.2
MSLPVAHHHRRHQLRLHLLALGCPIVGDSLYAPPAGYHPTVSGRTPCAPPPSGQGTPASSSYCSSPCSSATPRLHLHASSLGFAHPASGDWVVFADPPPFARPSARWGASSPPPPWGGHATALEGFWRALCHCVPRPLTRASTAA